MLLSDLTKLAVAVAYVILLKFGVLFAI